MKTLFKAIKELEKKIYQKKMCIPATLTINICTKKLKENNHTMMNTDFNKDNLISTHLLLKKIPKYNYLKLLLMKKNLHRKGKITKNKINNK